MSNRLQGLKIKQVSQSLYLEKNPARSLHRGGGDFLPKQCPEEKLILCVDYRDKAEESNLARNAGVFLGSVSPTMSDALCSVERYKAVSPCLSRQQSLEGSQNLLFFLLVHRLGPMFTTTFCRGGEGGGQGG